MGVAGAMTTDLAGLDARHVWHPYAPMNDPHRPHVVTSASGATLRLADGRELLDGMSSWWAAVHGYRHPRLDDAVRTQLGSIAHVMFGGLTHEPAIELVRRLVEVTPDGLEHVFLADSGSVSVEVALKMALQYQRGRGQGRRTRMLTIRGGYHGDTFGAMSVSDPVGGMHAMFADTLPPTVFLPRPPAGLQADLEAWLSEARPIVDAHADQIAAVIVEPVLQGAGGMHVYPPDVVRWLREQADAHGWLLILDEIATGFGRAGTFFAADRAGVTPDVMCVGKALSGGYLTLGATLCTSDVVDGVQASEAGALMHGPTYMGNPLACAVAGASLDLLAEQDVEGVVARIGALLASGLEPARELDHVLDVRTLGAVGVVQLDRAVDGPRAARAAADLGVWIRPFRDLVYVMPPYISTDDEVARMAEAVVAGARACR
jgi:adenosylmethionine-8-amino-7-oxononanoate aminotransferase